MAFNRRQFIGALVASASVGDLALSPPRAGASGGGQQKWLRSGLIDAGGSHEPNIFITRIGGQRLDDEQTNRFEESEKLIKLLHDQGVEVFHTHLYKGFGIQAEKEGMEATLHSVAIAHRYGMKADTYIQWNSMMYETFFVEEPRGPAWIQRDAAGQPILLPYGYQQSFRYRPCFANQEYLDYLKQIVKYAVVDVKTDFIHFDNFDLNAEPDSCHCTVCVDGFRQFLRNKYSPQRLRERLGFANVSFVNPPLWNRNNLPEKMEIIFDPIFQEWIDFRCQLMTDALRQVSEFIQQLNPDVVVEINPGGIDGKNRSWQIGVDHARLLKLTGAFWSEESDPPGYHSDGRLVSKIRSYKLARAYNNTLLTLLEDPVAMAEALAFNQTLSFVGNDPLTAATLHYIDFYRKYRDLYRESEDLTPIAVLRSYASLTNNNAACQLSNILVEQSLIQARIPFALIFDAHLHELKRYKVLVLPNTECLSDDQLALIRRYVEEGGGLVATESAGLYDEWRRVRTTSGLSGLVDHQPAVPGYEETVAVRKNAAAPVSRKLIGNGRVAYIPAIQFDGELPPALPYFEISNIFWKQPKNSADIVDAIRWAANSETILTLDGPAYLVANCTVQANNRRLLVHLVNYNASQVPGIAVLDGRVTLPEQKPALKTTIYTPEGGERALEFKNESTGTAFTLPGMRVYALVAIDW
jgi:Beta-galactosidase trimerisation domain